MRKTGPIIAAAALLAASAAFAQIPTFQTFSSAAGSTSAKVIVPQKPTSQVRVVSTIAQSDLVSSKVDFYSGTSAYTVAVANSDINSTLVLTDRTNGLANSGLFYIQGATSNVVATISSYTTTNISSVTYGYVLLSAGIGIPQVVGAEAELLGNNVTFGLGAISNQVWASDGLYVGNYGRACYVKTSGTANCQLNAVTVHYDGSSQ